MRWLLLAASVVVLLPTVWVAASGEFQRRAEPVGLRVHVDASTLGAEATMPLEELRAAFAFWEGGGNGDLRRRVEFVPVIARDQADVLVTLRPGPAPGPPCTGAGALGCATFEGSQAIVVASVRDPSSGALLDRERIRHVLAHELGHALGLGHSWRRDDIMYPTLGEESAAGALIARAPVGPIAWALAVVLAAGALAPSVYGMVSARRVPAAPARALATRCEVGAGGAHDLKPVGWRRGVSVCRFCGTRVGDGSTVHEPHARQA